MKKMIFLIIFLLSVLLFSQANATDYYVRPSGGSYGAGNGTSYADAWSGFSTINWTTVDNGNGTLWVAGTNNEAMTVGQSGEAGTPIIIRGYDSSASLRRIQVSGRSYITIDGLIIDGANISASGISFDGNTDYLTVQNTIIRNNVRDGMGSWSDPPTEGTAANNVVVNNCTIYNNGNSTANDGNGISGIYFRGWSLEVKNSTFYNNGRTNGTDLDHGIYIGPGIYRADIHDSRFYSHPHGNGIQSKGGQNGVNIYNNVIYNNYLGGISIIQNETWALTANIYNNIIYYNNDQAIREFSKGSGNLTMNIYNNSTYLNGVGGSSSWNTEIYISDSLTALNIKNNILYSQADDTATTIVSQSNMSSDYNIIYGSSDQANIRGTHGYYANPLYVNPPTNMTLQAGSPAINKGTTPGAPYNVDILGASRPQGAAYDIGAYEYGSGSPPPPSPDRATFPPTIIGVQ